MTVRPSPAERGYDARWRGTRRAFLAGHPLCAIEGCTEPATQVHHADGLGPHGPRGHDFTNLRGLCIWCHGKVTAEQRPKRRRTPDRHPGILPPEEWAS